MKKIALKSVIFFLAITAIYSCVSENNVVTTVPQLATTTITNITLTTAASGGNITSDGGDAVTARGIVWNTTTAPTTNLSTKTTDGAGIGIFSSTITNLISSSTYFVRAYATNSVGTAYGNELSFTTGAIVLPTVATTAITNITTNSAVSGGNITADGGGTITARGVVWSTTQNPTIALTTKTTDGTGLGNYLSNLITLAQNTTYYAKAYATNSAGTGYGNQVSFTTAAQPANTVTDIDGNMYQTVAICNQTWTKTNLNVSKYRNGDIIPQVTDPTSWATLTTGAWCYYLNDKANGPIYGKLYNWYAVNDSRGLAPTGYHIPSDGEWATLTTCLGGFEIAGSKLKETGTSHWTNLDTNATNSSGFTALPGGSRGRNGVFNSIGSAGHWWTSEEFQPGGARFQVLYGNLFNQSNSDNEKTGYSVRCIKD